MPNTVSTLFVPGRLRTAAARVVLRITLVLKRKNLTRAIGDSAADAMSTALATMHHGSKPAGRCRRSCQTSSLEDIEKYDQGRPNSGS